MGGGDTIIKKKEMRTSESSREAVNINDLPDSILAEIIGRVVCSDCLCKCKLVCKFWNNLIMSEPLLIGRFILEDQARSKSLSITLPQPPISLINENGEFFPRKYHPANPNSLTSLLKRVVTSLKRDPVVLGTCNDLVLLCATEFYQRDYFICNPYTMHWVALPPPSRILRHVPVGFICDVPFYTCYNKDQDRDKHNVHYPRGKISTACTVVGDDGEQVDVNVEYRCKVVRILPNDLTFENEHSYKFKVDIFSFDTVEWRESSISFPRLLRLNEINPEVHCAHNGMLYWPSVPEISLPRYDTCLVGLDPFVISSDPSGDDHPYQGRFIQLVLDESVPMAGVDHPLYNPDVYFYQTHCLVVPKCLQVTMFDPWRSILWFWELKDGDDDLTIAANGVVKLRSKDVPPMDVASFYLRLDGEKLMGNREMSNHCLFPLKMDPWWATPVPRLRRK